MTARPVLRLLLLAAMLLAPMGRMAVAQAMAAPAPAGAAMTGHCADMPAAAPAGHKGGHQQNAPQGDGERMAVDCMIACAAMAPAPQPTLAPPPAPAVMTGTLLPSSLTGIRPEAEPPPPRRS